MKKYTYAQQALFGLMTLILSQGLYAGVVSVTTSTPGAVDATNNDVTLSGAGAITTNGANVALNIGNVTTATNISIQNTSASDEISVNATNGAIYVSPSHVSSAPISITVDANTSLKNNNAPILNVASGATAASTITLVNNGTLAGGAFDKTIFLHESTGANNAITITNNGLIKETISKNNYGILSQRPDTVTAPLIINNTGTIFAVVAAIYISDTATASNPILITNSGSLSGNAYGIYSTTRASSASKITNSATGTIISSLNGLVLNSGMNAMGDGSANIDNAGIIRATGSGAYAVALYGSNPVSMINNSGTIEANVGSTAAGITSISSYVGTINNSSTGIIRSSGRGINIATPAGSTTTINNSGTISSSTTAAINSGGYATSNTIINQLSGSLSGGFDIYGIGTINITSGTVTGNSVCYSIGNCTLNVLGNFSTGGTFAYMKNIRTQNAGTQFNVLHAMTNADTSLITDANTTLMVKVGGSITGSFTSAFTNNGTLGFELGNGSNTSTTASVAMANNSSGFINMGSKAFNAAGTKFKITQASNTTLVKDARFYVLRTTGAITNIGTAVLDNTDAPRLVMSVNSDASGIYFKVTDILPPPVVTTSSVVPLTFIQTLTTLPTTSSKTIAVIISSPLLASLRSVLDAQVSPAVAAEYIERLSPGTMTETVSTLSASNTNLFDTGKQIRVLALRDHRGLQQYSAGTTPGTKGTWGQFLKANTTQQKRPVSVGYTANSLGFAVGMDEQVFDDHQLGVALGYVTTSALSSVPTPDTMSINTATMLIYGLYEINDKTVIDWDLNYSINRFNSRRYVPAASSYAYSKFLGSQKGTKALMSYKWVKEEIEWMPLLGFKLSESTIEPYAERGAALNTNLFVTTPSAMEATLSAGGRVKHLKKLKGGSITPTLQVLANYDFRARPSSSSAQFIINGVAQGASIFVQNDKTPNLSWTFNAGINIVTMKSFNIDAQINTTFKGNYHSEAGLFTVKYLW